MDVGTLKELSEIALNPETFELLKYCLGYSTPYSLENPQKFDTSKTLDKQISILAKNERLSVEEAAKLSAQIRENIGKGDLYEVQFFDPKWGSTGFTIELGHPFEYVRSSVHCIITQTGKRGLQSYIGHIGPSMFDTAYAAIDFIDPKLAKKAISGSIEAVDEIRSLVEIAKCKCAMILDISRSYVPIYLTDGSNFAYKIHPSKFYRSIPFIEVDVLSVEKMFDEITSIVDKTHKTPASIRGPTLAEWSHSWVNPQRRRKRACLEPRVVNPKESSHTTPHGSETTTSTGGDRKRLKTPSGSTPVNLPDFGLESSSMADTIPQIKYHPSHHTTTSVISEKDEAEIKSKDDKKKVAKAERDQAKEKAKLEKEEAKNLLMEEKKMALEEKALEKKKQAEEKKKLKEDKVAEKKRLQEDAKDRKKDTSKDKEVKELKDLRSKVDDEAAARMKTLELLRDLEETKKKIAEQEVQAKKGTLPESSDDSSSVSSSASCSSSSDESST